MNKRGNILRVAIIIALVSANNNLRAPRANLTRSALQHPSFSAWKKLYRFGDESSFLLLTGLTRVAFNRLVKDLFPTPLQKKRGRRRLLNKADCLGLYLLYITSTMLLKHVSIIFGVTPSTASRVLKMMLNRVIKYLKRHPLSEVKFPNEEKKMEFASLIRNRERNANNVIGFLDGLSLHTECSSELVTQNSFYNGYHADTMVNNILAYGPDGKVFFAGINFPGTWGDGLVASFFISKIIEEIGDYRICVDQGFPRSGDIYDVFVGPISRRAVGRLASPLKGLLLEQSRVYTSLRQASEWGMRALQGSFPRLKKRLPGDSQLRQKIIQSIIYIHNYRTSLVGRNQITTVFDVQYESYINIQSYDRIRNYFFPNAN